MTTSNAFALAGIKGDDLPLSPFYAGIAGTVESKPVKIGKNSTLSAFTVSSSEYIGSENTNITVSCIYESEAKHFMHKMSKIEVGFPICVWGDLRNDKPNRYTLAMSEVHVWSADELKHALNPPQKSDGAATDDPAEDDIFARIKREKSPTPTPADATATLINPSINCDSDMKRKQPDSNASKDETTPAQFNLLLQTLSTKEEDYKSLRLPELRQLCEEWNILTKGSKETLVTRLVHHASSSGHIPKKVRTDSNITPPPVDTSE